MVTLRQSGRSPNLWRSSVSQPPMPPGPPAHSPSLSRGRSRECSRRRTVASTPTGRRPTPHRRQPTVRPRSPAGRRHHGPPVRMPRPAGRRHRGRPMPRPAGRRHRGRLIAVGTRALLGADRRLVLVDRRRAVLRRSPSRRRLSTSTGFKQHDYKLRVDLRVGDCYDLNDWSADD